MLACPRCRLTLQPQTYEGTEVLFCDACWGHWLDGQALATILSSQDYGFSRAERDAAMSSWVNAGDGAPNHHQEGLPCPICGKQMTESVFADDCPVLVDRCSTHGTWLDAGEIKQLQVFVENR